MTTSIVYQRSFFADLAGDPLDNGSLYIGTANQDPETNPIQCYWDSALTVPATQPLSISAGYVVNSSSRAAVYVNADSFSLRAKNAAGVQVDYVADANDGTLRANLAASTGAGLVGTTSGQTVQEELDARPTSASTGAGKVGFSQSSSYSAGTVGNHLKRFICVTDAPYNATGDGSTDDLTAITAAVAAITSAGGGALWFPKGNYKVSGEITLSIPMTVLGMGATLTTSSASANIFKVTAAASNPGVQIEDIKFASSVTRTSGQYIESYSANGTKIRRCRFDAGYDTITVSGAATEGLLIEQCYIYAATSTCVNITAATSAQGITTATIQNNTFLGASSGSQTPVAIQIGCVGDLTIRENSSLYCSTAVATPAATGKTIQALDISDNWFDTGSASGVTINPNGGTVHMVTVRGNWVASFTTSGVVASGTGTFGTLEVIDNTIGNNGSNGVHISSTIVSETDIRGNKIGDNGSSGIVIVANLNKFKIIGNTLGATGQWTANTAYDILVNAGTSDNYIITHNFVTTGGTGNISDGGTGVNKTVTANYTI